MDDAEPDNPSLGGWQKDMQRLAAWMVRANRATEPTRPWVPSSNAEPS